jgi:hypothetical protein
MQLPQWGGEGKGMGKESEWREEWMWGQGG